MLSAHTRYCKFVNLVPCFYLTSSTVPSTICCLPSYVVFLLLALPCDFTTCISMISISMVSTPFLVLLPMHHSIHSGFFKILQTTVACRVCGQPLQRSDQKWILGDKSYSSSSINATEFSSLWILSYTLRVCVLYAISYASLHWRKGIKFCTHSQTSSTV